MSQSPVDNQAAQARPAYHLGWSELTRLVETGASWSGRERNCCFLNTAAARFADISAVSGLDFMDDCRAVAVTDWDGDGDLDLWLANRTGPRVRFLRNNSGNRNHFLALRLTGGKSNRDAIGARLELHLDEDPPRVLVRSLQAGDAFLSQSSKWVHFGLGNQTAVRKLVVRWPGSGSQTFEQLEADQRYVIGEGEEPRLWTSPRVHVDVAGDAIAGPPRLPAANAADAELPAETELPAGARLVLTEPIPVPRLVATGFDGRPLRLDQHQGPLLLNLWATWCRPCLTELTELAQHQAELQRAGLDVVALSVDGMRGDERTGKAAAQLLAERLELPFQTGMATPELLDKLDVFQDTVLKMATKIDQASTFPIPTSLLIDRDGRVVCIYQGAVSIEQLLADRGTLDQPALAGQPLLPFAGRWFLQPRDSASVLARFADRFLRRGYADDSQRYVGLAADLAERDSGNIATRLRVAGVYNDLGNFFDRQGQLDVAERHFLAALRCDPRSSKAHTNLGNVFQKRGEPANARRHYLAALKIEPNQLQAHINLGSLDFAEQKLVDAVAHFRRGLEIDPKFPPIHNLLGLALANQGDYQAAADHFLEALRLDPNYQEAHRNLATLRATLERGR